MLIQKIEKILKSIHNFKYISLQKVYILFEIYNKFSIFYYKISSIKQLKTKFSYSKGIKDSNR